MTTPTEDKRYFLRSRRLGFRRWRPADLDLALALWGAPEVTRYIDARPALSRDEIAAILEREIASEREHGVQYWPFFLRRTGGHIGCCGLRAHRPERDSWEIGVHVLPFAWRRGYATEAMLAVIAHAFEQDGRAELFAGHHPDNAASRALLQGLGFHHTHDELYPPTGLKHPSYRLRHGQWSRRPVP